MEPNVKRRSVLSAAGVLALGGVGVATVTGRTTAPPGESVAILEGTSQETTAYVQTGDREGPTVLVVGGIHGNEVAGYEAAAEVADLEIDSGRLVTVPRANVVAIEDGTRTGEDGVDLNRQFPVGSEPTTELARALWELVVRYEPDVVVDLHESISLYEGEDSEGVGQAVFHSRDAEALAEARDAADYLNRNYVTDSTYDFSVAPFSNQENPPNGLLVHKAARDTDATAFIVETVSNGPALETRVEWHTRIVRSLSEEELFDEGAPERDANELPTAEIETEPADAADVDLSKNDTVVLDGSASTDPDGEIATYEWDLTGNGEFEEGEDVTEVTLSFCGDLQVGLRVTDDDGATATETLVLSTVQAD